jgi:hypothetical protein
MNPQESIAGIRFAVRRCVVKLFPKIRFGRAEMFFLGLLTYKIFKAFIKKKKNVPTTCQWCQRRANGAIFACPKIWHQIFDSRCQLTAISTNRAICTNQAIRTNSNYRANANYYKF